MLLQLLMMVMVVDVMMIGIVLVAVVLVQHLIHFRGNGESNELFQYFLF